MSGQQCVSQIRAMSMEVSPRPPQSRAGRVGEGFAVSAVASIELHCIALHGIAARRIALQGSELYIVAGITTTSHKVYVPNECQLFLEKKKSCELS